MGRPSTLDGSPEPGCPNYEHVEARRSAWPNISNHPRCRPSWSLPPAVTPSSPMTKLPSVGVAQSLEQRHGLCHHQTPSRRCGSAYQVAQQGTFQELAYKRTHRALPSGCPNADVQRPSANRLHAQYRLTLQLHRNIPANYDLRSRDDIPESTSCRNTTPRCELDSYLVETIDRSILRLRLATRNRRSPLVGTTAIQQESNGSVRTAVIAGSSGWLIHRMIPVMRRGGREQSRRDSAELSRPRIDVAMLPTPGTNLI